MQLPIFTSSVSSICHINPYCCQPLVSGQAVTGLEAMEKTQPSMAVLEAAPPTSGSNHFLSRFSRRLLAALLALSAVSAFLRFGPNCFNPAGILSGSEIIGAHDVPVYPHPALSDSDSQPPTAEEPSSNRVPLEAHIMSKCPDAQYCLQHLVVPAMEQIHDKVDFRLSFIGRS